MKQVLRIALFASFYNLTTAEVIIGQLVIIVGFRLQNGREAINGK
jgi:hypothetical protein